MSMKWLTVLLCLVVCAYLSPLEAQAAVCEASPASTLAVFESAIATIYNIFPIRVGPFVVATFAGLEDFSSLTDSPVCVCIDPIPRPGIKVSLWEPIALIEPVKTPYCFPSLGLQIPAGIGAEFPGAVGDQDSSSSLASRHFQMHYFRFLPWALMDLFLDFICLTGGSPYDLAYFTEIDPFWQEDYLAAILQPEVMLFANPLAQMACLVDSAASSLGFPLDPLFWCMGSWGSVYPYSMNQAGTTSTVGAAAACGKMLAKLHREGVLYGSVGEVGLCGEFYMPIWRKSQYGIFPLYPIPHPVRIPIGRTDLLWGEFKDVPFVNYHNWVWIVYRKRDCCAF